MAKYSWFQMLFLIQFSGSSGETLSGRESIHIKSNQF